ncbi:MAG: FKBP-type peptidyl-prolyl cis-trans isomerase [Gemmatimonadota bacterium]
MTRSLSALFASIVIVAVAACGGDQEAGLEEAGVADTALETGSATAPAPASIATEYAPELEVNLDEMERTASGLYMRDVREGDGEAAAEEDTVVVHYTGWLPDGMKFDSSRDRGEPFSFVLGEGRVIPGWEEGVSGMRVGGQRRLVIPPDLGYGPIGAGDVIPPDATLVFDVELLEVR